MHNDNSLRVLFTGGGTGGHLYPAIALIEELEERLKNKLQLEILFIGIKRGLESTVLPNLGYPLRTIWIRGFQRGLNFHNIIKNLLLPLRVAVSILQSRFILKRFKPHVAIGTGGYTSGPPLLMASRMNIPFFILEQNVIPGITTRLLSKKAKEIFVSFENTENLMENAVWLGTPLRHSLKNIDQSQAIRFFDLKPGLKTVLIFGGSQGSHAINTFWKDHLLSHLKRNDCQFIWQTGQRDYLNIYNIFRGNPRIYITPFIHEMWIAYSASDLVVSRAGALTISELCLFGKPSILIPLPTAANNHQELNARHLEDAGSAIVVLQNDLNTDILDRKLESLIKDNHRLSEMATNALSLSKTDSAKLIIDRILKFIEDYV